MKNFTLRSNDLGGQVPLKHVYHDFGANGQNVSPALSWTDVPEGTESFLIMMHDKDAPGPGGFWHWCLFNLPGDQTELATGADADGLPSGTIRARNSYGSKGYGGPCPPPNDPAHPYVTSIYALKQKLDLDDSALPAMIRFMADQHILGKASIISYYAR